LVTKFYKSSDKTDYYFCYNPKKRKFEQKMMKLSNENLVKSEFPVIVPLDSEFKLVLSSSFDPNLIDEQNIIISLVESRIIFGKPTRHSLFDLKIKL
jgi:hypothetical protein